MKSPSTHDVVRQVGATPRVSCSVITTTSMPSRRRREAHVSHTFSKVVPREMPYSEELPINH